MGKCGFAWHGIIHPWIDILRRVNLTIFSVLLALGAVFGLTWVVYESPPSARNTSLNAGILVLFAALVGGRAAYAVVNWEYFQNHLIEIHQVWLGGLAWPGALAGGILGIFIVAWISKISVGELADRLLPLLASLSVAVWLGCWLTGCAYGPEIELGLPAKDEWGDWKKRLPLQLMGAVLTVALFWGIERFRHRKDDFPPGLAASLGLGCLSLILVGASILRVDPYPIYNGLRMETWAGLIFLVISALSGVFVIMGRRLK